MDSNVAALVAIKARCVSDFDSVARCVDHVCSSLDKNCILAPFTGDGYICYAVALSKALAAFSKGRNVSRKLAIEVLVRLYGDRQIRRVIERVRRDFQSNAIGVLIVLRYLNKQDLEQLVRRISEACCIDLSTSSEELIKPEASTRTVIAALSDILLRS